MTWVWVNYQIISYIYFFNQCSFPPPVNCIIVLNIKYCIQIIYTISFLCVCVCFLDEFCGRIGVMSYCHQKCCRGSAWYYISIAAGASLSSLYHCSLSHTHTHTHTHTNTCTLACPPVDTCRNIFLLSQKHLYGNVQLWQICMYYVHCNVIEWLHKCHFVIHKNQLYS